MIEEINKLLDRQYVDSRILFNKFRFIDENSKLTSAFSDPRFIPFYYHLGKFIQPKTMLEIGFNLSLFSGAFLQSCKTVEYFLGFQEKIKEFYPKVLALKNLKEVYKNKYELYIGNITDDEFSKKLNIGFDFVEINEKFSYDKGLNYLETLWEFVNLDGYISFEYVNTVNKEAFFNFCKIKNKEPVIFETRYGTGLIKK